MPSLTRPLVLAIDLDDTFAESPATDRAELLQLVEDNHEELRLVYMSHETAENLIRLAAKAELPVPEVFLADSGTTALKGDGTGTIEPLQRNIIQLWPGKESVVKALDSLDGVTMLPDDSPCRQAVQAEGDDAIDRLHQKLDELGCHAERRRGGRWDVLPYGVDKGSTFGRWLVAANIPPVQVIAFGQGLGDLSLFGRGWRGAVFAHAPEELKEEAHRFHNVLLLKNDGAKGVMEGLRRYGWLELSATA